MCDKMNYCMACSLTTVNQCEACFNWPGGTETLKYLDTSTTPVDCQETLIYLLVDECKFYDGLSAINQAARTINTCTLCKKDFLRWQAVGAMAICTDWAPIKCKKVPNCMTTVCFDGVTEDTTPGTYSQGCRMCDKGYSGDTWDTANNAGSATCVKKSVITNCDFSMQQSSTVHHCYSCATNYVVTVAGTSCMSFTTDPNCRRMNTGDVFCHYCWHSYFWENKLCVLSGGFLRVSMILIAIAGVIAAFVN
jgi:hypothetical protein